MRSVHDHLRDRLLERAGLGGSISQRYTLAELERSEWSPEFEWAMRSRLIMGALRYGPLADAHLIQQDFVSAIQKRLDRYRDTKDADLLADVACYAMIEFVANGCSPEHCR